MPVLILALLAVPASASAGIGCIGDGHARTVDFILDVNGNRRGLGTAYDAVRIGQDSRGLVVTGDVEWGRRHRNPAIHQDIVQALSGRNIIFQNFTSGRPFNGWWTCWGAGGGWYVTWANGGHSDEPGLRPLPPGDVQPEPLHRRVAPRGSAKLDLRLPPLLRDLHRSGSEAAGDRNNRGIRY